MSRKMRIPGGALSARPAPAPAAVSPWRGPHTWPAVYWSPLPLPPAESWPRGAGPGSTPGPSLCARTCAPSHYAACARQKPNCDCTLFYVTGLEQNIAHIHFIVTKYNQLNHIFRTKLTTKLFTTLLIQNS